ncbi:lysophospholipid acyltransferase family protein [Flaviflexus equikiangi]|uniref:1-acyl-sn-glycerol-3-phosphate acyltransferase n=1 Tax=Flaviflexus equikiangi TaxID=2758573 RepID=A0ABS2TDZ1_9ACTO|nr:lysophospholipid acyltransferase family protein [Flaviflexus equikiangi]MBM9432870.1 1-acyl-sn-glycerol-3-phosphate acyltransferase [Flaviflexus equikiangi]
MNRHESRVMPRAMRILSGPVIAFTRSIQRLDVRGADNIPAGPVIFVSNHTSHLDGFVVAVSIYEAGVPPRFVAKKELFRGPLGAFLRLIQQIEIDRDQPGGAIEHLATVLDRGDSLIIFPEGTFTHDPAGWPMRGKTGIARLAELRPDVPIIPVAHWGNERLIHQWTGRIRFSRILRRSEHVIVSFGPPLALSGDTYQEQADSVMTALAYEVARLRDELGRPMGEPPAQRYVPTVLHRHLRQASRRKFSRQADR